MGAADTAWHVLFGIEADAEALLSPTHLGLGVGACLIASGPIRAAWSRNDEATWPSFLPAILSAVAITGLVAFALHIANPFVDPWPRFSYELDDPTWYGPHIGVASAVVTTGIVVVPMLMLDRPLAEAASGLADTPLRRVARRAYVPPRRGSAGGRADPRRIPRRSPVHLAAAGRVRVAAPGLRVPRPVRAPCRRVCRPVGDRAYRLVGSSHRRNDHAGGRRRLWAQPAARRRAPAIGRARPGNSASAT